MGSYYSNKMSQIQIGVQQEDIDTHKILIWCKQSQTNGQFDITDNIDITDNTVLSIHQHHKLEQAFKKRQENILKEMLAFCDQVLQTFACVDKIAFIYKVSHEKPTEVEEFLGIAFCHDTTQEQKVQAYELIIKQLKSISKNVILKH